MTTPALPFPQAAAPGRRLVAILLLAQFVAMWTAFFILMPAIDWPASLDLPPDRILPLIRAQSGAVFAGYLSYLVHALLLLPIAALMPQALGLQAGAARGSVVFGALAGFAKTLGITRWLFPMPGLALAYTAPDARAETQAAIAVVYGAFNAYAGGVGEVLGVALFAGVWTLILSRALIAAGSRLLGGMGVVAAMLLFATLPLVVGVEIPALLTLSGIFWQVWTLALAIRLWRC